MPHNQSVSIKTDDEQRHLTLPSHFGLVDMRSFSLFNLHSSFLIWFVFGDQSGMSFFLFSFLFFFCWYWNDSFIFLWFKDHSSQITKTINRIVNQFPLPIGLTWPLTLLTLSCWLQAIRWCSEPMRFARAEYDALASPMNGVAMVI